MKYKIVLFDTLYYGSRFCGEHRSALLIRAKGAPEYLVTQQSLPFRIAVSSGEFNFVLSKTTIRTSDTIDKAPAYQVGDCRFKLELSVIWLLPWLGSAELSGFHCKIGFQRPHIIKQDRTLAAQRKLDLILMID